MKCLIPALSCAAGLWLPLSQAETLTIYDDVKVGHPLPREAVFPAPEGVAAVTLTVQKKGAKLGSIDTGAKTMLEIVAEAKAYDASGDPFYGPGFSYLAEDGDGHVFVIFFECDPSIEQLKKGIRAAMVQADDLGSNRAIFVGDPYSGSCFDESIIRQLQEITDQHQPPPAAKPQDKKSGEEEKK